METVSKYQIMILPRLRERYNLKCGQKMILIPDKNSLRLLILPEIESAYGFLEGIDTNVDRDEAELNRQHETQVIDERVLGGANNPMSHSRPAL
jgi:bifunctional DNA-binding transcriptional regulator/antitoxin component of YhaV-PrlF toxin-antitoxin module